MRASTWYAKVVLVLMAMLLSGCTERVRVAVDQPAAEQQLPAIAPEAKQYLDQLLALMQANSINRLKIDWVDFRAKVYARAAGAKSIEETRPAITEALRLLGDRHSIYVPKVAMEGSSSSSGPTPDSSAVLSAVPRSVGYIRVGAFSGTTAEAVTFSESIQQRIMAADGQRVTGWIVDLRGNTGGNMWPMLIGLTPILGDGTLGYFIDPLGGKVAWEIRGGVVFSAGQVVGQNKAMYRLQNEAVRVAVLTDGMTASSGEAVTIAFRGRAGTRSFGTPTFGVSTSNRSFPLSDGAMLYLTVSVMADRTGTAYGGPVVPDEVIVDPNEVVARAVAWLLAE